MIHFNVFANPPTKSPALPPDPCLLSTPAFRLSSHNFRTSLLDLVPTRFQGFSPVKRQARANAQMNAVEDEAKKEGLHIWGAF